MKQEKLSHNEMLNRVLRDVNIAQPINLVNIFKLFNTNVHVSYHPDSKQFLLEWGSKVGLGTGHDEKRIS